MSGSLRVPFFASITAKRLISVAGILAVGIAASLTLFAIVRHWESARLREELTARGRERAELLATKVLRSTEVLYAIRSFFSASAGSSRPSREQFREFVASALDRQPELRALEWVPRVRDAERAEFEIAAQHDGVSNFQFTQQNEQNELSRAPQRPEYFPVFYVEPLGSNLRAAGYDLATSPHRLPALERARDTASLVSTPPVVLAQETGEDPFGILVVLPIYLGGATPPASLEDRRDRLTGYTLAVFRISDLVDQCLAPLAAAGVEVTLRDADCPKPVYARPADESQLPSFFAGPFHPSVSGVVETFPLQIAGRNWELRLNPTPAFAGSSYSWQSWSAAP